MRLAILFSGGKDSTLTLHRAVAEGHEPACLVTILPRNPDSYMFQQPFRALVEAQSAALGLPVIFQETPGVKEEELAELRAAIERARREYEVEGVGAGALASNYQFTRLSRICGELGLRVYAPLWQEDQEALLREVIREGYEVRMTRVAALGLGESWLGRVLSEEDVAALGRLREEYGFQPGGEGGEFETIVLDSPLFEKRVVIAFEKEMKSGERGELLIKEVQLVAKEGAAKGAALETAGG